MDSSGSCSDCGLTELLLTTLPAMAVPVTNVLMVIAILKSFDCLDCAKLLQRKGKWLG